VDLTAVLRGAAIWILKGTPDSQRGSDARNPEDIQDVA
jgi:hypothetical protein